MSWQVGWATSMFDEFSQLPRNTQKRFSDAIDVLTSTPKGPAGNIKKLKGWRHTYRYRLGDYRLIYRVGTDEKKIDLCYVGHRKDVYEAVGHIAGEGPRARVIANSENDDYLETPPGPQERFEATIENSQQGSHLRFKDEPLPEPISKDLLRKLRIPEMYWDDFLNITSGDELLWGKGAEGIENYVGLVLDHYYPSPSQRVAKFSAPSPENIRKFIDNPDDTIIQRLLRLDETQRNFVERFKFEKGARPKGPWLLKGGPGSGKTTIALYCIREIILAYREELAFDEPPKILFTTFTNALVNLSSDLLSELGIENEVDVITANSSAWACIPVAERKPKSISHDEALKYCEDPLKAADPDSTYFKAVDKEFLLGEVAWIIIGNNLKNEEEYKGADRKARGRRLGAKQKSVVWKFYEKFCESLKAKGFRLFDQQFSTAAKHATPRYDYIFVDEAQDLSPIAIRFLTKLLKDPKNIFLTADLNQSIHLPGFSWPRVSESLRFTGRVTTINKNHRTTRQIMEACAPMLGGMDDRDRETLDDTNVTNGPCPEYSLVSADDRPVIINEWIKSTVRQERVHISNVAILCPNRRMAIKLAGALPKELNSKVFFSNTFDMKHPGVKCAPMQSTKGLQFPIVIIAGMDEGMFPRKSIEQPFGGKHWNEDLIKQQRVLFVACTRAMRRLLIVGDDERPSRFIQEFALSEEGQNYWEKFSI